MLMDLVTYLLGGSDHTGFGLSDSAEQCHLWCDHERNHKYRADEHIKIEVQDKLCSVLKETEAAVRERQRNVL